MLSPVQLYLNRRESAVARFVEKQSRPEAAPRRVLPGRLDRQRILPAGKFVPMFRPKFRPRNEFVRGDIQERRSRCPRKTLPLARAETMANAPRRNRSRGPRRIFSAPCRQIAIPHDQLCGLTRSRSGEQAARTPEGFRLPPANRALRSPSPPRWSGQKRG